MRDYSEKRVARESIERKPVAKNRPRRESNGMFMLLSVLALCCTFGAGAVTGWVVSRKMAKPAAPAVAQAAKKEEVAPAVVQPKPDAPLTFYKTLPAGGRGAIGTGLNLKKPEPAPAAARPAQHQQAEAAAAPAAEPAQVPATAPAAAVSAPLTTSATAAPAAAGNSDSATHFVVQVASYREKQEAVAAQTKLAAKGVAAYLVESRVADKGVWYRLRVGRHLTRGEAGELAGKAGKGAMVLPE